MHKGCGKHGMSLLNGISSEEIIGIEFGMDKILYSFCVGIDAVREDTCVRFSKIGKVVFGDKTKNVILTMEAVIFEHNISLDYDIEPDLITHGNSEQIQQVVMILLDNAVKYTNSNGSINISLKKSSHTLIFTITNTGEGIPEEHIHKIFDHFYRTDKSRARESGGYRLGLAIAKTIIDQSNGKITVESVLNESTSFMVELPRVKP